MFGSFGIWELVIILVIIVIIFGATRIPALLRGVGEGVREFKDAVKEPDKDDAAEDADATTDEV